MNIFVDYHHSGLLYSLHLALENRLGHKIFRPIGMEWFEKGYWDIAKPYGNSMETARQFLEMRDIQPIDGTPPLNTIVEQASSPPYYTIYDAYHDYKHKAVTFDQFMAMDIDVIIGSIPDHWVTYKRLRDQHKPNAKVVCHMGNMFNEAPQALNDGTIDNLLASTIPFMEYRGVNKVFYYQEQPLVEYRPPMRTMKISSYAHTMPKKELYDEYKQLLPQFQFKSYGSACPDGWMHTLTDLYKTMQEDMFVYHVKPGGDGYGWNWHSAFMVGRPILTNYADYKDKLGGLLFKDGVTGLALDAHTVRENCDTLTTWTESGYFQELGQNARNAFMELVNYENEADKLKTFFENLH